MSIRRGTLARRHVWNHGQERVPQRPGRLPERRVPHTTHGVWNLSGGGVQEQMDRVFPFTMVGRDGYSMKRFPIRSSLSDETPPLQPALPVPVSTGSREQTPLAFERIHAELCEPLTPTCNWQHKPWHVPQISGVNFKPANLTYYTDIFF